MVKRHRNSEPFMFNAHSSSLPKQRGRALALAFGALAIVTLGVFWYVASPTLGPIYDLLRTIETAGLWRLTNWSHAFRSVPPGRPPDFWSIYISSIPFGLFIAVVIATIAAMAYEKRRTRHLYTLIIPKPGALTPGVLRARMRVLYPHLGASNEPPPAEWDDDTPDNAFADLPDLRNPIQVRAALQALPAPVARVMFLALAAPFNPTQPIGGLRPGTVEADAWKSTRASSGKPSKSGEAARAALTGALVLLINGRAGAQGALGAEALEAQDEALRTPGTTANMLIALIAHARRTGFLPMSSLRWVRWTLPQLAIALIDAGVDPLVTVPVNANART